MTAVNTVGESRPARPPPTRAPAGAAAPAQVTGVQATGSQSGIALTWTASTAPPDLAGYHVYRSTTADGTYTKLTTHAGHQRRRTTTPPHPAGATSYYQVTAVTRDRRVGARSATANAARPAPASRRR